MDKEEQKEFDKFFKAFSPLLLMGNACDIIENNPNSIFHNKPKQKDILKRRAKNKMASKQRRKCKHK